MLAKRERARWVRSTNLIFFLCETLPLCNNEVLMSLHGIVILWELESFKSIILDTLICVKDFVMLDAGEGLVRNKFLLFLAVIRGRCGGGARVGS